MTAFIKIKTLFDRSIGRALPDAQLQPDPALVAEGWERRFTSDAQRAQEAIELYTQLGYEVRAEPLLPEQFSGECEGCHSQDISKFKTIYTRKKTI
jgi:hypothetical protein